MSQKKNIRILIVDDEESIRQRLRTLLSAVPEFEVVGDAENGKVAMELAQKLQPDVVIMDVDMPITDGVEATRWITSVSPNIKVIASTSLDNEIRMMVRSGASDLIYKFCGDKEIVSTIKSLFEDR